MRCRVLFMAGIVGIGALAVWKFGAAQTPPSLQPSQSRALLVPDLPFAQVGGTTLSLDLARPAEGDGPFPAVVCLHGGGWVRGDRKQMAQTIEALARRGYVAVAPDYRLAPKHRFPAQIEDCKAAVRWLRANAAAHRIDQRRLGAVGLAAGGHLACLLGVTRKEDGLEGNGGNPGEDSTVQAVVSFFGPTDLTWPSWDKAVVEQNLVPLLGGTFQQVPGAYGRASPMTYANRGGPPFLLLHGNADAIVPPSQAQDFAQKLVQSGGSARVVLLEGEGHAWRGDSLRRSIAEMLTFFDEKLKP
jgi:acetyl esterase/lipase